MSSTNRGAIRSDFDYYRTNPDAIVKFLKAFARDCPTGMLSHHTRYLDPCAGGNVEPVKWLFKDGKYCSICGELEPHDMCRSKHNGKPDVVFDIPVSDMPYPEALRRVLGPSVLIDTNDIRPDSPARQHLDFINSRPECFGDVDAVITNPPFSIAMQVIRQSLRVVRPGGLVIMLLRLNYFGSEERFPFFQANMPAWSYVDHKRLGFTPDGKTDSIEYMHAVWVGGREYHESELRVI